VSELEGLEKFAASTVRDGQRPWGTDRFSNGADLLAEIREMEISAGLEGEWERILDGAPDWHQLSDDIDFLNGFVDGALAAWRESQN
jgi:hypothetical protein